jgi:parallel beta-helix repeat protein
MAMGSTERVTRWRRAPQLRRLSRCAALVVLIAVLGAVAPGDTAAATYFVRQTVGDDSNDGLTPATAWKHFSRLSPAMSAGDTAFVGPGLYREQVSVEHDGTPEGHLTFIADTTGQHTGDPPGVVMVAGSEPVDGKIFAPTGPSGVYAAPFPAWKVWGAVEMDGPQQRYENVLITHENLVEKMPPVDIVAKLPSSWFYDDTTQVLTLHTSDGRPPAEHEMELIRRGDGIFIRGKHHVTVVGFTFRHMQDAGVSFFIDSGDGVIVDVTSYGSRQGVRIYGAKNILLYGNTLFRNENSGAYFANKSVNGLAMGNTAYENVKGLRWSSDSVGGMAVDNTLFDNSERGISIENADGAILRGNRLVNNAVSQLLVLQTRYTSENNCFSTGRDGQLVADFTPFGPLDRYPTLAEYRAAKAQDMHSLSGACGPLPAKVDVHALHAAALAYPARPPVPGASRLRGWLDWLRGR